jgi:hypothetical protein
MAKLARNGIVLIDFETGIEEDRDRESVRLALMKHNTLFRFLFDKYTAKQSLRKQRGLGAIGISSDYLSEKSIKAAELLKLLRDHNINHNILSKTEMTTLMKMINGVLLTRHED